LMVVILHLRVDCDLVSSVAGCCVDCGSYLRYRCSSPGVTRTLFVEAVPSGATSNHN
jgi:hypothetical protein